MKILIVQCNTLIKAEVFADLKKTIAEDYKKTGIVFLPCDFSYDIVEVDDVTFEETDGNECGYCGDCVYYEVPQDEFPCVKCARIHPGPEAKWYFKEKK